MHSALTSTEPASVNVTLPVWSTEALPETMLQVTSCEAWEGVTAAVKVTSPAATSTLLSGIIYSRAVEIYLRHSAGVVNGAECEIIAGYFGIIYRYGYFVPAGFVALVVIGLEERHISVCISLKLFGCTSENRRLPCTVVIGFEIYIKFE